MYLFFDTETTGLFRDGAPQPRLVSLAALLCTKRQVPITQIHFVIKPDGFTIPPEASAIHGITNEMANEDGIPIQSVFGIFIRLAALSDAIVAYNISFDLRCLKVEYSRFGDKASTIETILASKRQLDVMKYCTPICRLPSTFKRGEYKWPKLAEAYKHLFNEAPAEVHNSLSDVHNTAKIYFRLLNTKLIT
jgi:DNA polymerase III epsilon subunit-like protein